MISNLRGMGAGFLGGLVLGVFPLVGWMLWVAASTPVPYRDVHIIEQWRDGEWLHVTATFIKTECEFRKLVVLGHELGESRVLPWEDREEPAGDRLRGLQTLRINIGDAFDMDRVEIRTRHDCGGSAVDKTFAWLDPREEIRPPDTRAGHGGHLGPVD